MRLLKLCVVTAATIVAVTSLASGKTLSFEERVKAQEAIERVYYAHRIWPKENPEPKPPFEQMVPRSVIESKVTDYLKKCAALDRFWQRPIRPEQLQAEMDRMAKQTKDPETLKEIFAALGNDPYVVAECLARPLLADQLIHNWYGFDTRYHSETKAKAQAAFQAGPSAWAESKEGIYRPVVYKLRKDEKPIHKDTTEGCLRVIQLDRSELDQWLRRVPRVGKALLRESHEAFLLIHTVSQTQDQWEGEILYFGKRGFTNWWDDSKVDPGQAEPLNIPEHAYVLPSFGVNGQCIDQWKGVTACMSEGVCKASSIWTGTRMIVWGGFNGNYLNSGGQYDPATDSWTPTSTGTNCPEARIQSAAVWTGTVMIAWGGYDGNGDTYLDTGGRYDPVADTWTSTSTAANCPVGRNRHTAVWTGSRMIVWGGYFYSGGYQYPSLGGQYEPATDTWTLTSTGSNCPFGRDGHTAVWTGSHMIVWGGCGVVAGTTTYFNSGGVYDPVNDTWAATSTGTNCPAPRNSHSAIWTGNKMIIWGGSESPPYLNTGGQYDPIHDTWTPTSTGANCPSGRYGHTAVWTGNRMIVWGAEGNGPGNTGGQYDPLQDSWTLTSTDANCPSSRAYHTAVWTGTEMIVWGGYDGNTYFNSGGRYDPATNSWTPVAPASPSPTVVGVSSGCSDPGVLLSTQFFSAYQWIKDGLDIPGATAQTYTSTASGTYSVRVTDGSGCQGTSAGHVATIFPNPTPVVTGASSNTCPATTVPLSAGSYTSYQWRFNGSPIAGATSSTYNATLSGNYSVSVTDSNGCSGTSADKAVTVTFCAQSEVSPQGCVFPARLVKTSASPTGYYLYFQKIDGTNYYNVYCGTIGSWYSHNGTTGRMCAVVPTDMGTGEKRISVTPPTGNRYYLVTGVKTSTEGPSGFNSQGVEIPKSQSTCPP